MGSLKLCFGSQAESLCLPFIQTVLTESTKMCGVELQVPSRALYLYLLCVLLSKPLCAEQRIYTARSTLAPVWDQGSAGLQTFARHV